MILTEQKKKCSKLALVNLYKGNDCIPMCSVQQAACVVQIICKVTFTTVAFKTT
jgi:hypothetical protein